MTTSILLMLLTSSALAAEPRIHRDLAYVKPGKDKTHATINREIGLPNDKPTKALFEFLESITSGQRN